MGKHKQKKRAQALARRPQFPTRAAARAVGVTIQDHPALRASDGENVEYSSTSAMKPKIRSNGRNRKVRRGA